MAWFILLTHQSLNISVKTVIGKKLIFNRNDEVVDLSKNIYEITLEHKKREIEEEKNKILAKPDSNNFSKKRLAKK